MAVVTVVTLAVAMAAMTTVFTIFNAGYFKPLPYPDADRLVAITANLPEHYVLRGAVPREVVDAVRRMARSFERVAAFEGGTSFVLADERGAVQLFATKVDTALLPLLGVHTQRGRLFSTEEVSSLAPVVLISDSLWRTRYGKDEAIVGRAVRVDDQLRTVVGVLAPGFRFSGVSDLWVPLSERADTLPPRRAPWPWLAGKLNPGISLAQVQREIDQIGRNLAANDSAEFKGLSLVVESSIIERSNAGFLAMVAIFLLVTLCVFLIACTNVGNLLLVRAAERRAEMAVRAALGASRARLIQQNLTESALLAAVSGTIGAILSMWIMNLLLASIPTAGLPSWLRFEFDARMLTFVIGACFIAVLLFGLAPAREGASMNLISVLKAGADVVVVEREVMRRGRRGVVVQIALSLALFVTTLLFARSWMYLSRFDRGYDAAGVVEARITFNRARSAEPTVLEQILEQVRARLAGDPRVGATALYGEFNALRDTASPPGTSSKASAVPGHGLFLPDVPETAADRNLRPTGSRLVVTDEYFTLLGIPIVRGRGFGASDAAGGTPVAIVSERVASVLWRDVDPVGKRFMLGANGPTFVVVGVARDVRDPTSSLAAGTSTAAWPHVYFPARQATYSPQLYLRPRAPLSVIQGAVQSSLAQIEPGASLWPLATIATRNNGTQLLTQLIGSAIGTFAVCGALLAMLGVYAVIAYGVTQRTREIGLLVALGATPEQVVGLFTRQGLRFTAVGVAIGLALAFGLSTLVRAFIWGVSSFDPLAYLAAAIVFGALSLFASWLPAKRASRVEPLDALRSL